MEHIAAFDAAVNADRSGQASDTPVTRAVPLDPAILARRARLRKMVAWALVPAALIAVIGGARLISRAESAAGANHSSSVESPKPPRPLTTNLSRPASASVVMPVLSVPSPGVSAEPERSASASAEPAASQPPPEPAAEPVADLAATRKQVLKLLNQGKFKDALPLAQAAVAADPSDADLYLYEGTALEELGRRKEAIESYSRCVHQATKGPVQECRALGGK
jgi:tetratricopeptide (TPR) repeat protein